MIKLNNNIYYIVVDLEYKNSDHNIPKLCLKNFKDDYWDEGDCSKLIEKIEKNYTLEKVKQYDKYIAFMADVLYIYDRLPFLGAIKDVYISKNNNLPDSICYIEKQEIEDYIKTFNVKMQSNDNFKLFDEYTWKI